MTVVDVEDSFKQGQRILIPSCSVNVEPDTVLQDVRHRFRRIFQLMTRSETAPESYSFNGGFATHFINEAFRSGPVQIELQVVRNEIPRLQAVA
jgi:hypothetical protein